ncbi:MAG: hypothetical protein NTV22_07110 [bacterium]|nr:hypothetical protein [bacterium]
MFITSATMRMDVGHKKNNLKQLYLLLSIYRQQFGSYPTLQSNTTGNTQSGGVRDLYPLWTSGVMKREQLKLLQPQLIALVPFTHDPTTDEFDHCHIGYSYNSTAMPDDPSNPPLMADRGVSDGRLDKAEQPLFDDGARVLFDNSMLDFIPAVNGQLATNVVTAEQWRQLRD